jgi:RNA polymerase sigma factor for flagellar operon FliA
MSAQQCTGHDRVVAGMPFVTTLARRLASSRHKLEVDDLVQDGLVGLMAAAARFEPARGIPFEAFATSRVRGAMVDGLRRAAWPRQVRRMRRELHAARTRLRQELGAEPTLEELAGRLRLAVVPLLRRLQRISAMEDTVRPPASPAPPTPDVLYVEQEARARVRRGLAGLPPRDQVLIQRYYFDETTMAVIAAELGVTPCRVSQLHQRALRRLRGLLATTPPVTP